MSVAIPEDGGRHGLRRVLGEVAWQRLPPAVRERFGEPVRKVDYVGEFESVRASWVGYIIATVCRLIGTPVVPRTGRNIPAIVHVGPAHDGVRWNREYQWPRRAPYLIRSTKVFDVDGSLVERLPARLCMPLRVYESGGTLHFVSRGYYFDMGIGRDGQRRKIPLPPLLSPGTTHVEHRDEPDGWFRFTMSVRHPFFGEIFFQTGRFRAAGNAPAPVSEALQSRQPRRWTICPR